MNEIAVKPEKPDLLAVEGKDEVSFFEALFDHMGITGIQIMDMGGKDRFRGMAQLIFQASDFDMVRRIGLVRDAESNKAEAAFRSICGVLKANGLHSPANAGEIERQSGRAVGIFIMPDNHSNGMLEDLCLQSVKQNPSFQCVDSFFDCLSKKAQARDWPVSHPSKALVLAYLSTRAEICNSLGIAARKGYWDFSHPCFANIKAFLQELFA